MWLALVIVFIVYSEFENVSGTKCNYAKPEREYININKINVRYEIGT